MSESEQRPELAGLARSIDSLFSSAEQADSAPSIDSGPYEVEEAGTDPVEAAPVEAEPAPEETMEAPEPDPTPVLEADTLPAPDPFGSIDPVEPTAAEEAPFFEEAGEPVDVPDDSGAVLLDEPILDASLTPVETSVEAAAEEEAPAEEPAVEDAGALDMVSMDTATLSSTDGPPAAAAVAVDEDAPTPLQRAVAGYIEGGHGEDEIRRLAEEHLAAHQPDPVAEAAETLMFSGDAAPLALGKELLSPPVRARFVARMGGERVEERREQYYAACNEVGEEMARAIAEAIGEAEERFARWVYHHALVAMGPTARPVVEEMAVSDNTFLARNGVAVLGDVGGDRAGELVVQALAHSDARVRKEALASMVRLQVEGADDLVTGCLEDSDEGVLAAAIAAAGELRVERAVRPLTALLQDPAREALLIPLLHALGHIGDPGPVPAIEKHAVRKLFSGARTDERIAAYQALHHIGTPHAMELIQKATTDKDSQVAAVAQSLLSS